MISIILVEETALRVRPLIQKRPVMVDGTSINCDRTVTNYLKETSRTLCVVPNVSQGIVRMDILANLHGCIRIDIHSRRLYYRTCIMILRVTLTTMERSGPPKDHRDPPADVFP